MKWLLWLVFAPLRLWASPDKVTVDFDDRVKRWLKVNPDPARVRRRWWGTAQIKQSRV